MTPISKNIRYLRKQVGMSQVQLAKALEVSRTNVTSWESANNYPGVDLIIKIARIFDISIDDLLTKDMSKYSTSINLTSVAEAMTSYDKKEQTDDDSTEDLVLRLERMEQYLAHKFPDFLKYNP